MRRGVLFLLAVFGLVLSSALVAAQAVPGGVTVDSEVDLGPYPTAGAGTATVTSGAMTVVEVSTDASTYRWAGLMGNVSGNIVLGDSANDQIYTWTGEGKMVYASDGPVTWASLADANEATVLADATWLAEGSDNYSLTFTEAAENIGSGIFDTITSDFALTDDSTGTPTWKTYSLWDTTNLVWAGLVNPAQDSYKDAAYLVDFQMIIPEDGTGGDNTATTYNLWVELV